MNLEQRIKYTSEIFSNSSTVDEFQCFNTILQNQIEIMKSFKEIKLELSRMQKKQSNNLGPY